MADVFLFLRVIAIIMSVSFVWTILLFVELYVRWNISDTLQREYSAAGSSCIITINASFCL